MQQRGQRLQAVHQAGARAVDDGRVNDEDAVVADGGDVAPAGAPFDGVRGGAPISPSPR